MSENSDFLIARVRPGLNLKFSGNSKFFNGDKITPMVCFWPQGNTWAYFWPWLFRPISRNFIKKSDFDSISIPPMHARARKLWPKLPVFRHLTGLSNNIGKSDFGFGIYVKIYMYREIFTRSEHFSIFTPNLAGPQWYRM